MIDLNGNGMSDVWEQINGAGGWIQMVTWMAASFAI